jgi:hypothetical protein
MKKRRGEEQEESVGELKNVFEDNKKKTVFSSCFCFMTLKIM